MSRTYKVTFGQKGNQSDWPASKTLSEESLITLLTHRAYRQEKDGACIVAGELASKKRGKFGVKEISLLVYDIDGDQSLDEVDTKLKSLGLRAILFTTHSHKSEKTEVKRDDFGKWLKNQERTDEEPCLESVVEYLLAKGKTLGNPKFDYSNPDKYTDHSEAGLVYVVHHDPIDKLRVVFFLDKPIELRKLGATNDLMVAAYTSIYMGVGMALGLRFDEACKDPSRLYYLPSSRPGAENRVIGYPDVVERENPTKAEEYTFVGGKYLDWAAYPRASIKRDRDRTGAQKQTLASDYSIKDKNGAQIALYYWDQNNGGEFDFEALLEKCLPEDMLRARRTSGGGFHIECPFEEEHTIFGGVGTFCVNGDGDKNGTIYCAHNTCLMANRSRIDYLKKFILDGYIVAEDLGIIPQKPRDTSAMASAMAELGIKAETLPSFEDMPESSIDDSPIDVKKLDIENADEISGEMLQIIIDAAHINIIRQAVYRLVEVNGNVDGATLIDVLAKNKNVGYADIKALFRSFNTYIIDGYNDVPLDWNTFEQGLTEQRAEEQSSLSDAVHAAISKALVGLRRDREIRRLADYYGVTAADVRDEFDTQENNHKAQLTDASMCEHMAFYTSRYAFIDVNADILYLDMDESRKTSEAKICKSVGLKLLYKAANIETVNLSKKKGKEDKLNTFTYWQDNETATKHFSGVTFDPSEGEITSENKWNMWNASNPWSLRPKKGDCSPCLDHILEVWCGNDVKLFNWVMLFLADIIQRPGKKHHSAIILIGGNGTGKSIILESGMAAILGKLYGASADREAIIGKHNKHLTASLLWLAEEALFSGDKKAMGPIKDRISRETIDIEAKYVDKIVVPNFTRYIFSSNMDHAIHLEGDDRRFLVLRTTDKYKQDVAYFTKLRDWFDADGAAILLHYLMNFAPADYGLAWSDLFKAPMTEAKEHQIALGRDPADEFFIDILRHGRITGLPIGTIDGNVEWGLDGELTAHPETFRLYFDAYLKNFMGSSYRYDRNRWTMLFKRYFTKTPSEFAKVRSHGPDKKPTKMIVMVNRREIIEAARKAGVLPESDYAFALDNPNSHLPRFNDDL